MVRRRLIVISSAIAILAMGLVALLIVASVTQTDYGRERIREMVGGQLAAKVKGRGKVYLGQIGGNFLTGVTIDSLEIRDAADSLFLATGPVKVDFDPRDIFDRRILVRALVVQRPWIHVKQSESGQWNYKVIFGMYGPKKPPRPKGRGLSLGDFIVLDSAVVQRGTYLLTMPWHPDDSLRGARRDSAVAFNLARKDREIRRTRGGFARTWRWTDLYLVGSARLAHPDTVGRRIAVRRMDVVEKDPPFRFRNVRGTVALLGDSAWLDLPHFDLPGSTGAARGKVVWGSSLPVRYAIHVRGDSVSMADVAWVYPTLPTTGGGRLELEIRNDPRNLRVIDYAITKMDVRSMDSRLLGRMTYGVGGPVLVVKDVDLEAAPVDFRLIRQLNGKDFPYPWAGTIAGHARGPGGPLNRFRVAQSSFVFRDANVPGAVSVGSGQGELDILRPAFTAFHGFSVVAERLDLRTPRFLNPEFPPLGGYVTGRAVLDSSWLDVRFRNADLRHVDGPGEPSHFTGLGRVTWGEKFLTYDLTLEADPVSLTMLARSYPELKLRGPYRGPMRVQGTTPELQVATTLTGAGGTMTAEGLFDVYEEKQSPDYAARATGTFTDLDLAQLVPPDSPADADAPETRLAGRFDADVRGWTLADLVGRLAVDLGPSRVDSIQVTSGRADLRFEQGRMRVDTLRARTPLGLFAGAGALGLRPDVRDTLPFVFTADSLGGFRRWLLPETPVTRARRVAGVLDDTLDGNLVVRGTIVGSLAALPPRRPGVPASDSAPVLDLAGTLEGGYLRIGPTTVRRVGGDFAFGDALSAAAGTANVALDTLLVAGVRLARAGGVVTMEGPTAGRFRGSLLSETGPTADVAGAIAVNGDTTAVRLDSLAAAVGESRYRLERPTTVTMTDAGTALDSIFLRGAPTGWLRVAGALPNAGPARLTVDGDSLALGDLSRLLQTKSPLGGLARVSLQMEGTRASPVMRLGGSVANASVGDVRVEGASLSGTYADRRLDGSATLMRQGKPALLATASLPVDLALQPVVERLVPGEPLRVNVRSDSIDLGLVEALSPKLKDASGDLFVNVDVLGTWKDPRPQGSVRVARGALLAADLGVQLRDVFADVAFQNDSILVNRVSVRSGEDRGDTLGLTGAVALANLDDPSFRMRLYARSFHAMARPRVADLWLATDRSGLLLEGSVLSSRLRGGITVTRGDITIPELAVEKKVIQIDDAEFLGVVDTTLSTNRTLLGGARSGLAQRMVRGMEVENVRIAIGDNVWLRSREANIKLGGEVGMSIARAAGDEEQALPALEGAVTADRGTYRLALGPVQRTFEVEQGTLQFFGDADLNPTLDIRAVHAVRQSNQGTRDEEVRIRVKIGGTLASPQLSFESADSRNLSTSDLLSYLVTGGPSFEVGENSNAYVNTALGAVLPSLGTWLSGKVGGGAVDVIELQTAGLGANDLNRKSAFGAGGLLSGTRVGAGKQINDRTYLGLNFGLCELGRSVDQGLSFNVLRDFDTQRFLESVGVKLDYRLSSEWTASLGVEPGTSARLCGQANATTIVQAPKQLGFDFFRRWEF
ncbi:MAG: translocation/assembly module TamB domain-containing protein [Gemmatimonadaceae bacterium]